MRAAEAHVRAAGCGKMQIGILSVADDKEEPEYKKKLAQWYLRQGYEHRETLMLRFEPDEVITSTTATTFTTATTVTTVTAVTTITTVTIFTIILLT
jgi:hypothetical protein